jgi:alkanesulfonate monooxygenase SsuD/methylene tetrahydromethanopterin reductase-like flavin-dependent oxidoreductase (luciferase family)
MLATSGRQAFAALRRGQPITLPPPSREFERPAQTFGGVPVEELPSVSMVGSPATVEAGIARFVAETAPDELMVHTLVFDHAARRRSYELLAAVAM